MAKFEVWAMTNKVRSESTKEIEIDDEDLEGLDISGRDDVIEEIAHEAVQSLIEWGWREKE